MTRADLMDTEVYFKEFDQEVTIHTVLFVTICVLFCMCIAICMQRRQAKRDLKQQIDAQIRDQVNKYMALSDRDTEARDRAEASYGMEVAERK